MAAEITASAPTGLVLTARLAQGATIGASITLTESGTLAGYYTGNVPGGTAAGRYAVTILNGTTPIGAGELRWDGSAELVPAIAGDAMAMTAGAQAALVTAMQAGLLNEGDGQTILAAIVAAIGNTNVDQIALVAAIRADIERGGGMLATRPTLAQIEGSTVLATQATAAAIKAKTDLLPAAPAAVSDIPSAASIAAAVWAAGSRTLTSLGTLVADTVAAVWAAATRTLTADPGAAAHAATQTAVAAVPANVRVNLATELARLDVAVSTREAESAAAARGTVNVTEHDATQAAIAALTAPPSTAAIAAAVRADIERAGGMLDAVPTASEMSTAITAIGDPLTRAVPGTYPAGSAGEALGKLVVGPPDEPAVVIPGAPAEAALCRVYGYVEGIDNGKRLKDVKVSIRLVVPSGQAAASERLLAHIQAVELCTDAQGRLIGPNGDPWVDLQRNDELDPSGTVYEVTSKALGVDRKQVTLTTQTADLRTLLLA